MPTATMTASNVTSSSEEIFPAARGEFYSYTSRFSLERPLYFLLKCKSNKARPTTEAEAELVRELDLTFIFGDEITICSADSDPSMQLLSESRDDVRRLALNNTEIRTANVTLDNFYQCWGDRCKRPTGDP